MRKIYYFYSLVLLVAGLSYSCAQDEQDAEPSGLQKPQLSIEEARAFFDQGLLQQQTRAAVPQGIFSVGAVESNWSSAEMSAVNAISCVDVPTKTEFVYFISRVNAQKETWSVRAWSKLTVVKSVETGIIASYMHFFVPETEYAKMYDCDVSDFFANCQDRYDYSGLEFYTTLDGFPVAAAKYVNGKLCASAFLSDKKQSYDVNLRALAQLLCNLGIQKTDWQSAAKVSSVRKGDFDPMGRKWIIEDTGHILIVIDEGNGDYSLTPTFKYIDKDKDIDIDGGGGGGGSGSPGGNGMGDGLSPFPDIPSVLPPGGDSGDGSGPGGGIGGGGSGGGSGSGGSGDGGGSGGGSGSGDGGGSGGGSGSGGSGGSGDGDGGGSGGGTGGGTGGSGSGGGVSVGGGTSGIQVWRPNPIPWNPPPPDIPPAPEPKRPCFDNAAVRANPLLKMKILGTKNNGIAGGRYGMGRGRMHNGIDLVAEVGTPVYAMFDGEIKYKVDRYDPKLPYKQYPYKYPGDKQENYNAGNRVWIECVTSKGRIILKYFHLNSIIVKVGDVVSVGDLIGYAGITGSACSSGCAGPHLHLEVWNNGTRVNPEPYLYTQFNQWGDAITKDCNE